MREIKFRAWDKFNKTMTGVSAEQLRSTNFSLFRENCELLQYTGLEDKNGKDIYEGDVCVYNSGVSKSEELVFSVTWDERKARFAEHLSMVMSDGSFLRSIDKVEIIGNIYSNPELLTPTPITTDNTTP